MTGNGEQCPPNQTEGEDVKDRPTFVSDFSMCIQCCLAARIALAMKLVLLRVSTRWITIDLQPDPGIAR